MQATLVLIILQLRCLLSMKNDISCTKVASKKQLNIVKKDPYICYCIEEKTNQRRASPKRVNESYLQNKKSSLNCI